MNCMGIFQLSHDRGMQKHDSLGVETICLTCNQLVQCQGVYIEATCLEEIKQARLHKSVFLFEPPELRQPQRSTMLITDELTDPQSVRRPKYFAHIPWLHWLKRNKHPQENEIPALQLWRPTTKLAEQSRLPPPPKDQPPLSQHVVHQPG